MNGMTMGLMGSGLIVFGLISRQFLLNYFPKRVFVVLWCLASLRLLLPLRLPSSWNIISLVSRFIDGTVNKSKQSILFSQSVNQAEGVVLKNLLNPTNFLAILWGVGSFLLLGIALLKHLKARGYYRLALPVQEGMIKKMEREGKFKIRVSDRIAVPLTYGIIKPIILLPKTIMTYSFAELELIVLHESIHIKHRDTAVKILLLMAVGIHWFNPFVWLMYIIANHDMELACDEEVIRQVGFQRRADYARLLVMFASQGLLNLSVTNFSGSSIKKRIVLIMKMKKMTDSKRVGGILLVVVSAVFFLTSPSSANLQTEYAGVATYSSTLLSNNQKATVSVDGGKTWLSAKEYEEQGLDPDIEWWTATDYEAWLSKEKKDLKQLIDGNFFDDVTKEWRSYTTKDYHETITMYEEILSKIKKGGMYSKTVGGQSHTGMALVASPDSSKERRSSTALSFVHNGKTKQFEGYESKEDALKAVTEYCQKAIKESEMTEGEASEILNVLQK